MKKIKATILNNKTVIENYFFMTVLQILNSLFYLIIYPYLIRTLGAESYGLYVFAFSISVYFVSLVQFGFDTPALKEISQQPKNSVLHAEIISTVFFSKLILLLLAIIIFVPLLFINIFRENTWLFIICFSQVLSSILFPTWYFQGIQKMKIVTYIQLSLKIISLPLIFLLIKHPSDVEIFATITISTGIIGGVVAMMILRFYNSIKISWVSTLKLKESFKDAMPFFLSSSMNTVKQQTASVLIGSFFTMSDVALYDLAMKIFMVPTTLISSINGALFPKMMLIANSKVIKKVLRIENLIGIGVIFGLAIFGKWIILIMGGENMSDAYPLLIIVSLSVFVTLTVGAITNFIFVPLHLNFLIVRNQIYAIITFVTVALSTIFLGFGIISLPISLTTSGFVEIFYCYYNVRKHKLYSRLNNTNN